VQVYPGEQLTVAADGTLLDQQGQEMDRLRLVSAAQLTPMGGTSWRADSPIYEVEGVEVVQGALESSNTDAMRSMTELMEASRYFEAYQKAMQTSDQLDAELNQMMGQ
jgi:flagellar basal-body rod protein FlgF